MGEGELYRAFEGAKLRFDVIANDKTVDILKGQSDMIKLRMMAEFCID